MELIRPDMTRWSAQLVDRAQEQRFRSYHLNASRRTAVATLVIVLAANAAMFAYHLLAGDAPVLPLRVVTHIAVTITGTGLAIWLAKERRYRWMVTALLIIVAVLTTLIAMVLVTSADRAPQGALMIVGGVALIYLAVPLTLIAVAALALGFTAATLPIWIADADGFVAYTVTCILLAHVLSAIEARRARQERRILFAQRETLLALSSVDPLTGLINRRSVDTELARAWQYWRTTGTPVSVLMIDIDHFKSLNDSQGHVAGDHALRLVATVLSGAMPIMPGQVAARYGGEEFCCLLAGLDASAATVVAGRILAEVRRIGIPLTVVSSDRSILTVSVGVAQARDGMTLPEHLIAAADRQLYRAKSEGRNCVRVEPAEFRDAVTAIA